MVQRQGCARAEVFSPTLAAGDPRGIAAIENFSYKPPAPTDNSIRSLCNGRIPLTPNGTQTNRLLGRTL